MSRLVWLTDLHFNAADADAVERLIEDIHAELPTALLIGGDIAESDTWEDWLHVLQSSIACPIFFVLGNHDYYRGSIAAVRHRARELTVSFENLNWLPAAGVISLDHSTAVIGHGGWGDARAARFQRSNVILTDYFIITELRIAAGMPRDEKHWHFEPHLLLHETLERKLQELGDEAAAHFAEVLPAALEHHDHVIALMHVPPFRGACWYDGRISDDHWAPHFCCIAAGDVLREVMQNHPEKHLTVLCGHTHGRGTAKILPNLIVHTGGARYGAPKVQRTLDTCSFT